MEKYTEDSNQNTWEYRLVSATLERRRTSSSVWFPVAAASFLTMTPTELRHIADVIEHATNTAK